MGTLIDQRGGKEAFKMLHIRFRKAHLPAVKRHKKDSPNPLPSLCAVKIQRTQLTTA